MLNNTIQPLKLIRQDRGGGYGYAENEKFYCITRTAKGSTLYDKQTHEMIRVFSEIPYVVNVAFYQDNLLFLKNLFGKYYLYNISSNSFEWKARYKPNANNQETHFILSASGIIVDADCNVKRPETGCILKIDPWSDRIDLCELEQLPRYLEFIHTRLNEGIYVHSGSRIWALNMSTMTTTLLYQRDPNHVFSEVHHCDGYGNIIYSYQSGEDDDFTYYQLICRNLNTGDETKLDTYQYISYAANIEKRIPVIEKTRKFFRNAYFAEDPNYIIQQYAQGIRIFDLRKQDIVYTNLDMDYTTHVSSTSSGIIVMDGKFTYFLGYNDLQ